MRIAGLIVFTLSMTKAEVKAKLDEIVAFAGVERYLDTPVKRYSSGMMVRLGFAVGTPPRAGDPDSGRGIGGG